jgi:hypothetical protein
VADAKNENDEPVVFDLADEPKITDAVFPKLAEFGAVQGLTDASRIVQWGDAFVKEFQDALALLRVEFAQFAVNLGGKFNSHA